MEAVGTSMALSLQQFAHRLGTRAPGTRQHQPIESLATPAYARSCDVSFCIDGNPGGDSRTSAAAAIVSTHTDARALGLASALIVDDVLIAIARAASWLPVRINDADPVRPADCAIDAAAKISSGADLADSVRIGEQTVIDSGAVIGNHVSIGAFCTIEAGVVISGPARIGNRVHIGAGTVIGTDGFSLIRDGAQWLRIPNFGGVRIGDDVTILAQVVLQRGVFGDTIVGPGCALDSQVLIGHDSNVGDNTAIAGQSAVAGAARIGRNCLIGGKVGIGEGIVVADRVTITAMSMVMRSIEAKGSRHSSGWPAENSFVWWRRVASVRRASNGSSRQGGSR